MPTKLDPIEEKVSKKQQAEKMQTSHGLVVDGKALNMSIDSTLNMKFPNNSKDEPRIKEPLLDDSLEEIQVVENYRSNQKQEANITSEYILAQMNRTINSRKFQV